MNTRSQIRRINAQQGRPINYGLDCNEDNLKPCPFCGSEHILTAMQKPVNMGEYFMIKCFDCSAEIKRSAKRKAVEAWNKRNGEGE